jgi:hypothetical protein
VLGWGKAPHPSKKKMQLAGSSGEAAQKTKKSFANVLGFIKAWDIFFFVSNVVTFKFSKFLKKEKSIYKFFLFYCGSKKSGCFFLFFLVFFWLFFLQ